MAKVIDISDWQEDLDWQAIVDDGVQGVIIKIAEGTEETSLFRTHLENAKAAGLKWGVYVFTRATTPEEASNEAENVLTLLDGETPELGVWYDIEPTNYYNPFDSGVQNATNMCSAFIVRLNQENIMAGIYAGYYTFVDEIDIAQLGDYVPFWVAQYGSSSCALKDEYPNKNILAWQYTETGDVAGRQLDVSEWYDEL